MALKTFELVFSLAEDPKQTKRPWLLTSDEDSAKDWLIKQYGKGKVILKAITPVKEAVTRERTCRICLQTRTEIVQRRHAEISPNIFDESTWEIL